MRPYFKSFPANDHYLLGASRDMFVIVLNPDLRVIHSIDIQADCTDQFSISQDGKLLAIALGLHNLCCIEVIQLNQHRVITPKLREKATVSRIDGVYATDLRISPKGDTVVYAYATKSGGRAIHIPSGEQVKLPNIVGPTNAAWLTDRAILPLRRSRHAVCVSYWPLAVHPVELPSGSSIWRLTENPDMKTMAMLSKDRVACVRSDNLTLLWHNRIPDAGWISYSGDGRFIAVRQHAPQGGRAERILILSAKDGQLVRTIAQPEEQALFPLDGSRFLCYSGRFLNAETGEFDDGMTTSALRSVLLNG